MQLQISPELKVVKMVEDYLYIYIHLSVSGPLGYPRGSDNLAANKQQ